MDNNLSRRSFLTGSAAAAALALAACGGGGSSTSTGSDAAGGGEVTGGGTLSVASAYATQNYHPSSTSSALALSTNWNVVEGLYELDFHDYSTYNGLATGDPVQIDETTFEVSLREGAAFSDGTPVTAEDVVTSFARSTAEGNIYIPMLAPIASVEAKDDATVTITTTIPNFSLLKERLAIVRVVPSGASDEDLTTMPIGSGPWMYESITDETVSLLPNEHYNGDHPAKDAALRFDSIVDPTARVTAQQEGSTLVMESVPAENIDQITAAGCRVDTVQGFGTRFLMFDIAKAPWDNVKVRQAVMYALNYDQMITNALAGMAASPKSYLPETFANFHEASTVYTYDPDKAKQLIEESGITPGAIELRTTDNAQVVAMSTQVKNDLDALGFDVTINTQDSPSTYAAIDEGKNEYDLLLAPGDPSCFGADPDLLMNWWFGDNVWMQSRCPWKDSDEWKQLHELMDQALTQEPAEQQETWNQCFDIIAENCVLYPVLHVQTSTASWSEVGNPTDGTMISGFSGIGTTGVVLTDCATAQ